jgi:exodeoxyribonuclease-3
MLKIASWNVNSLRARLDHVKQWIQQATPDVLAVQETKTPDDKFPLSEIESWGYQVKFSGQKAFNGVALLSRHPLSDITTEFPHFEDPQRRVLGATLGDIRILNVYVPNGESVGSEKYHYKLMWLTHLHDYLKSQLQKYPKLIVLGDFNIAPEDRDVHDPAAWEGSVLVSLKERKAFQEILALGLQDAFRLFDQPEKSFSWWDYRMNAFRRNMGLRLDLMLVSHALSALCEKCLIDKTPRTLEKPSDHAPVVAIFR